MDSLFSCRAKTGVSLTHRLFRVLLDLHHLSTLHLNDFIVQADVFFYWFVANMDQSHVGIFKEDALDFFRRLRVESGKRLVQKIQDLCW